MQLLAELYGTKTAKSCLINFEWGGDLLFSKMLKSVTKENCERKWNIQRSEAKNIPLEDTAQLLLEKI